MDRAEIVLHVADFALATDPNPGDDPFLRFFSRK